MENKVENPSGERLSEKVKGVIRRLRVSRRCDVDYYGEKDYRTVYALGELTILYIDAEVLNLGFGEEKWEAVLTIRLFRLEDQKAICVAEKKGKIEADASDSLSVYTETLAPDDLPEHAWKTGVYRVLADVDGVATQSDDLYVIQGEGHAEEYFRLLHAGLDRCCEETEQEAQARDHSFRTFDIAKLRDIRFFFMAQNLCGEEWVYEFVIRVVDQEGRTKALKIVKSARFMKDQAGNSMLCFAVDLGDGSEDFMKEGRYALIVSSFDRIVLRLEFEIGAQDEAYQFEQEVLAGGGQVAMWHETEAAYSDKDKNEILDRLYRLVGLRKVKEEITQICDYAEFIRLRRENGFSDRFPQINLIFTGHPGTGKNTVAEMVGELFCKMGLLSNGRVHHYSRRDLVREGAAVEEQLVRQALGKSKGGVMFVEEAGDLFHPEDPNDRGVVALTILINILAAEHPEVLVILADEAEAMDEILQAAPDLKKIFPRRLCFEDYTPEELMEIARSKLEKLQYRFTPAAEDKFYKMLKAACLAGEVDFTNGKYIDERLEEAASRMSGRVMANRKEEYAKEDLMLLTEEDIVAETGEDPRKSLDKLEAMIGMGQLKQNIVQHLNYVYFIRERQKHGFPDMMPPLNMIFSGNPGTGKTTVAKMMGEIYQAAGILAHSNVVVQNAYNLMGEGGMTPQQVAAALMNAAQGRILYIDQADVLLQTEFGKALFELLLAEIPTDTCGDTLFILGGYPELMNKMLEMNPGLRTYFPYYFRFNDYTPEELLEIALNKLKEKDYVFHPKALEAFKDLIRKACEKKDKRFGNVLLVDKMVGMAIRNMSERTMQIRKERELTRQEMTTIRLDDIPVRIFEMPAFDRDIFDEQEIKKALDDLDKIVGQTQLKKQIRDFVELARHYCKEGEKLSSKLSLQWCLTGNSAMGKGTVARIIGRLYKAMGIVNNGQVVDFKVEKMVGMTEEEAMRYLGEALMRSQGGIFLFDEDSPKLNEAAGFRERVRAILMNQMAERPGSCILIYAEPLSAVPGINGNAEHLSELVNVLVFEDYTKEELMVILKRRLEKEKMRLTSTARQYMSDFIATLVSTEERSHASSRLIRIVGDLIVRNCLQRLAKNRKIGEMPDVISVQKQDVTPFTEQFVLGLMKERKRIGFV